MSAQKQHLFDEFLSVSLRFKRLTDPHPNMSLQDKVATMLQHQALDFIKDHPKATAGEVGKHLILSSSSTAQLLDRLTRSNFISRRHDDHDKRIVHITLTKEGQKKLEAFCDNRAKRIETMMKYISETDIKTMLRIMKEMVEKMQAEK